MNLREELKAWLESKGCKVSMTAGIWFIIAPDGQEWDMTVPMKTLVSKDKQIEEANARTNT